MRYEDWLERQPLSERTRREYSRQVARFSEWLAGDDPWAGAPLRPVLCTNNPLTPVRASLGLVSNLADVPRLLEFVSVFGDLDQVPGDLPARIAC